jgi:prepilin-type N-terminal cleavage/methylation domain-containing protein
MLDDDAGYSLLELLISLTILTLILGVALPNFFDRFQEQSLNATAASISYIFREAQAEARYLNRDQGIRFDYRNGGWSYNVYEDGNGDGVHSADIARGIDTLVRGPLPLPGGQRSVVTVGLAESATDPDTLKSFPPGTPAVQFNGSLLCSFAPEGSSTPGTIYLVIGKDHMAAVRCSGSSGRIRIMHFAGAGRPWTEK